MSPFDTNKRQIVAIEDEKADIRDLDVGDLNDMESDEARPNSLNHCSATWSEAKVPAPFLEHLRSERAARLWIGPTVHVNPQNGKDPFVDLLSKFSS